jgi:hypothetical protein
MSTIGMILQVVGVVIGLVGGIWLLVVAFQESIGWGIGCLLCGLVGIIFAIQHWEKAKKPFLIEIGGAVLASIGGTIASQFAK